MLGCAHFDDSTAKVNLLVCGIVGHVYSGVFGGNTADCAGSDH